MGRAGGPISRKEQAKRAQIHRAVQADIQIGGPSPSGNVNGPTEREHRARRPGRAKRPWRQRHDAVCSGGDGPALRCAMPRSRDCRIALSITTSPVTDATSGRGGRELKRQLRVKRRRLQGLGRHERLQHLQRHLVDMPGDRRLRAGPRRSRQAHEPRGHHARQRHVRALPSRLDQIEPNLLAVEADADPHRFKGRTDPVAKRAPSSSSEPLRVGRSKVPEATALTRSRAFKHQVAARPAAPAPAAARAGPPAVRCRRSARCRRATRKCRWPVTLVSPDVSTTFSTGSAIRPVTEPAPRLNLETAAAGRRSDVRLVLQRHSSCPWTSRSMPTTAPSSCWTVTSSVSMDCGR